MFVFTATRLAAGGRSRLLERNPREIPAAPGSVRHGSVSRARLLWAAALLLEAIATDTPGNPDASVLPSSREAVQRARALGVLAAKANHPTSGQPRSGGNGGMDHVIRAR